MKILVIGQAPPAIKQGVPYDTTMMYEWLEEVGIDKQKAQEMFEWEAVYDQFPGRDKYGKHLHPTKEQMKEYWKSSLREKVIASDKIWVLGRVARDFLQGKKVMKEKKILHTIHPSKLNLGTYRAHKDYVLGCISSFLKQ